MTEEALPTVTVIICAYTEARWELLSSAIESVARQSQPVQQCVLVVDHNTALFNRALAAFIDIDVIENSNSRGLAGARNSGIASARHEIVAFLDDDATAEPDWLGELIRPYADESIQGTGGVASARWASGRPRWYPSEFEWVVGCSYRGLPEVVAPIRNPIGASMSYRRSVFAEVGDFDTEMGRVGTVPIGCEETLLGIRVVNRFGPGCIVQVPASLVHHYVGPERSTVRYLLRRCFAEGISKAAVAKRAGAREASSAERRYVMKVLPSGFIDGLRRGARGDFGGFGSAFLIVTGLVMTGVAFTIGQLGLADAVTRIMTGHRARSVP